MSKEKGKVEKVEETKPEITLSNEEIIEGFFDINTDKDVREPIVVGIAGNAGLGKTHFANTFPIPIIADTEGRSQIVMKKFDGIRHRKVVKNMKGIREVVQVMAANMCPNEEERQNYTFVFDSSSDFQQMAESEYLIEAKKEKIFPIVLWAKVFDKMDIVFNKIRELGFNAVFTQQLKEEWLGDKPTGTFVPAGYKKLPYRVDIHLLLQKGIEYNGEVYYPEIVIAQVLKDCWNQTSHAKPYLIDVSYDGIFNELKDYTHPQPGNADAAIKEILKELEAKTGIPIAKSKATNKEG